MPFALLVIGAVLVIAAVRDKHTQLFELLRNDFTGQANFIFWFVSILAIGAVGYVPKLQPLSRAFLALVIVVLFLNRGQGFFTQFSQALGLTTVVSPDIVKQGVPENPSQPLGNNLSEYLQRLQPLGGIQ